MQAFEWYVPPDRRHWRRLQRALSDLKQIGVDNIWIPPACKAMNSSGNGYDIYDLYDLGEFDQKGSVATKWGSKEDLELLTSTASQFDIGIYWDAVLNHRAGADYTEKFPAVQVDPQGSFMSPIHPACSSGRSDYPQIGMLKYHVRRKWKGGWATGSPGAEICTAQ